MDSPGSAVENDDVSSDTLDGCHIHDCTAHDISEPSGSGSTLCDPEPVAGERRNYHRQTLSSPAVTIRRRSVHHGSSKDWSSDSSFDSECDEVDDMKTSAERRHMILRNLKENENLDSNQGQIGYSIAPSGVQEENIEGSTITTAANDHANVDSAESEAQSGYSSSNLIQLIIRLVIKTIGFQINLFIKFITFPIWVIYHSFRFYIDPFGTIWRGMNYFTGKLSRVCDFVCGFISPSLRKLLKEHKFWKVTMHCGWGFLWFMYICFILFGVLLSSLSISGFMMKYIVEKPIQRKEVLNFDYTKPNIVAYVPITSCAGIVCGEDCETNIGINNMMDAWVIPPKQKVQVTVSLLVPESEYNRNLGVFQVRVDFLSSSGKTITSLSQSSMLRFRSKPIRLISTFLKIFPLIAGYASETQTIDIKMQGLTEGVVPTSCVKVTLLQRAEYRPGAGIPEIYDASLSFQSEVPFFKRTVWNWRNTIFVWITMTTFMVEVLLVLVCCRSIIIPKTMQRGGSARGSATQNNHPAQS